jgi:tripartite-type tricarboxylate transporter receptor subunit TctC
VPTLAEAGLAGYETLAWFGMVAPAKTPADVIAKLQSETARVLARPDVRAQLTNMGAEPSATTPEAFSAFMQSEITKYSRVIREAGIKVE